MKPPANYGANFHKESVGVQPAAKTKSFLLRPEQCGSHQSQWSSVLHYTCSGSISQRGQKTPWPGVFGATGRQIGGRRPPVASARPLGGLGVVRQAAETKPRIDGLLTAERLGRIVDSGEAWTDS